MLAALSQRLLHQIFLPDIALADKFDLDPVGGRQPLCVLTQPVPERLGEFRVIEDPHLFGVQIRGHSLGVADLGQRAENQYPIPTTEHARNLILESLRQ
jgi:hypothetical protein